MSPEKAVEKAKIDLLIERVASAISDVEFKLPGAGGLRGRLRLAPAQAREMARVAIKLIRISA